MELKVRLEDGAPLPKHARPGDAGMDLTSRETVVLAPGETRMVGTGVHVEIPDGFFGMVVPRSGLGSKGVNISNCCGIIDSSYRGEIMVPLHNNHPAMVMKEILDYGGGVVSMMPAYNDRGEMVVGEGERVCQLVVVPYATCECVEVDELSETARQDGGFGSTGKLYAEAVDVLESLGLGSGEAERLRGIGREAFGKE